MNDSIPQSKAYTNGKSEAQQFLLRAADFIYELIDYTGTIDENSKEISVPQAAIYFFQNLLNAVGENNSASHLAAQLALLDNPVTNKNASLPDFSNLGKELEIIWALIGEEEGRFVKSTGFHFRAFKERAQKLVNSPNFLFFANDVLPEISSNSLQIRYRELTYLQRLTEISNNDLKPRIAGGNRWQDRHQPGTIAKIAADIFAPDIREARAIG